MKRILGIITVVWWTALSSAALAKDVAVDLELVLAVDISGSIDEVEARLQREGYVNAIIHPDVLEAIKGGMLRRIAVTYIEWAGLYQTTLVDWHLIEDERSAAIFAQKLLEAPIFTSAWTSISGAINYALPLFQKNGYSGVRQVIDLSGDGPNNEGEMMPAARDRAVAAGVTVNGLPIVNDRPSPYDRSGVAVGRFLDRHAYGARHGLALPTGRRRMYSSGSGKFAIAWFMKPQSVRPANGSLPPR